MGAKVPGTNFYNAFNSAGRSGSLPSKNMFGSRTIAAKG
jgi:hypothetical protein